MTRRHLSIEEVARLFLAAEQVRSPAATALQLCILCLARPWEVAAIDLAEIDWRRGCVAVPARGVRGRTRTLALSSAAQQVILQATKGIGTGGQAITGGRGRPVRAGDVRLDRLRAQLGVVDPNTLNIRWNMHDLRVAGATALYVDTGESDGIYALLGAAGTMPAKWFSADERLSRAIFLAERWSELLLHERACRRTAAP